MKVINNWMLGVQEFFQTPSMLSWFHKCSHFKFLHPSVSCQGCPSLGPQSSSARASPRPPFFDQQLSSGEARNDGPEAGPVGPDGRRGGARLESGAAGHEAAKERGGEAEVRWNSPASAFSSIFTHLRRHVQGDVREANKERQLTPVSRNDQT